VGPPLRRASLVSRAEARRLLCVPTEPKPTHFCERGTHVRLVVPVSMVVHRFDELIGGHAYQIEVALVAQDRWRAYIVRRPGVTTALMPFYGTTPTEAADQLCQWLARAHARAADGARSA
jgi:hypothetical protein